MKTKAAVAFEPNKPLEIVELDLAAPRKGEVLVEIVASGVCHTDAYTLDGRNPGGYFPVVLGHEGAGIVREVGGNVHGLKPGDHVIPPSVGSAIFAYIRKQTCVVRCWKHRLEE